MTAPGRFRMLPFLLCFSRSLIKILITTLFYFAFVHGEGVVFYRDVDFKGPVVYNFTVPEDMDTPAYRHCFNFDQSKGQALSLKTSNFLILWDQPRCDGLLNFKHHSKEGYKRALWPGEYPDLAKYLRDGHFPCRVLSTQVYYDWRWLEGAYKNIYLLDDRKGEPIVQMRYLCGCVDVTKSVYERVRAVRAHYLCVKLFSEPRCRGRSVTISPGVTAASHDLRRVSFKGVTKSFSLCEEIPCDAMEERTEYEEKIRNETKWIPQVIIPTSLNVEEKENEPVAEQTLLDVNVDPPVNVTCKNGTNFTCVTSCGGVLYSKSGAIHYKFGESLESFERCVWIIKPQKNWSSFDVTQIWRGFKSIPGKQEVVISEFVEPEDWENTWDFRLNTLGLSETTQNVTVNGPMIIITLYTEELETDVEETSGFILEYNAVLQGLNQPLSPYTTDLKMEFGETLCYPSAAQEEEEKFEVSTFLFLPNNDKDELRSGLKNFVVDTGINPEMGTYCTIILYEFVGYKWKELYPYYHTAYGKNTGSHRHKKEVAHDDMVLIMLKSYAALPERGFCMNSTVQDYKICLNSDGDAQLGRNAN